ncbi:MAG: T9SS type A sorting domain-containing protein [Bacteroidales bacterium]|nr:T9SS type A sorting domain-containing protein [Bacteroidales bacterium]
MNHFKIFLAALFIFSSFSVNAKNVTWENETIKRYTITEAGTYRIKGKVIGCITIKNGISGTVYIEGPGLLDDYDEGYRLQGKGGPEPSRTHRFTILSEGSSKVIVRNLDMLTNSGHKTVWLSGNGSRMENCKIECVRDRNLAAMAVQASPDGVIDNVWAKPNDDCFKVNHGNSLVKNSTAVMQGNGSAITLDYNNKHNDCFARNCTIRGKSYIKVKDQNDTRANGTALCAVNNGNVKNIQFTDIRVEDGKKFSHIILILQKQPGATVQDVLMTGTLPNGAAKRTYPGGTSSSPVCINAYKGTIKDVVIDFGGALSNPAWHFLNGKLENVCIDGHLYNGTFNNKYGNQVNSKKCGTVTKNYTITSTSGTNGEISSSVTLPEGSNHCFTVTPNAGFELNEVIRNGVVSANKNLCFNNISKNHTIHVTFKKTAVANYTLTSSAGNNGSISPSVTVKEGANHCFTVTPDAGYSIDQVVRDGNVSANKNLCFNNVNADHTISVTFKKNTSTTITFGTVITDCNKKGKTRNIVPFTVSGTNQKPKINKGQLIADGGDKYRIRHLGAPFKSKQTYKVTVGAESKSITVTTVSKCPKSAMSEMNGISVETYPNPAGSELNILLSNGNEAGYSIISMTGAEVDRGVVYGGNSTIDVSSLKNGIYTLQINTGKEIVNQKITINR